MRYRTGTAGRIENAQVAVYLIYTGRRGHAAVDRELYVPRSWNSDPDRCRTAGLGGEAPFVTEPELAARMGARFLDAGHQAARVAGDEVRRQLQAAKHANEVKISRRGLATAQVFLWSMRITAAGGSTRTEATLHPGSSGTVADAFMAGVKCFSCRTDAPNNFIGSATAPYMAARWPRLEA